jgi:membrane protein DedA with SNARE-associated domain
VDLSLLPFAPEIGYLGLGLVSFFGSLIPFVPLPAFLFLATMAVGDQFNLHILAILSAVLSAGAKQIIFYVSYGGRKIINTKTRKRMRPFERLVKKYGGVAAFAAAATPIPDDLVYVPLGLAKYNPKRFFVATISGKLILHYVIVMVSHFLGLSLIEPLLENVKDVNTIYIGVIIFGVVMTCMIIFLLRLDWAKILGKFAPWTLDDNNDNNDNNNHNHNNQEKKDDNK